MPKFSLEKLVDAKRNEVYSILSNYENYEKLCPQHFPSIRIRSVRNNTSVVEEHIILGDQEFVIMAKHVRDEPSLHEIFVIGGDLKGSYFKQQFQEISDKTKIITDVDLKIKGTRKISFAFKKEKLEKNYNEILNDFIKLVEG